MKASGTRGAIVNVTSAAGLRGGLGPAAYSASKAGVIALTQQAACECAPAGIRVNSVAPAYVSTVRCVRAVAENADMHCRLTRVAKRGLLTSSLSCRLASAAAAADKRWLQSVRLHLLRNGKLQNT